MPISQKNSPVQKCCTSNRTGQCENWHFVCVQGDQALRSFYRWVAKRSFMPNRDICRYLGCFLKHRILENVLFIFCWWHRPVPEAQNVYISQQTIFLCKNQINTYDQLKKKQEEIQTEMDDLISKRKKLTNKVRRTEPAEKRGDGSNFSTSVKFEVGT